MPFFASRKVYITVSLLTILPAFLAYGFIYWKNQGYIEYDDFWIFARYARNIVEGHGPVFNPGERVEGFTSPLWLGLITFLYTFSAPVFLYVVQGIQILLLSGILSILIRHTGRDNKGKWIFGVGWVLLLAGNDPWRMHLSGMDVTLFLFLISLALSSLYKWWKKGKGGTLLGISLAGLVWCRPEGMVLAGVISLFTVWAVVQNRKKIPIQQSNNEERSFFVKSVKFIRTYCFYPLLVGISGIVLFIVRYFYYGEFLPNTYFAKVYGDNATLPLRGIIQLFEWYLSSLAPILVFAAVLLFAFRKSKTTRLSEFEILCLSLFFVMSGIVALYGGDYDVRLFLPALIPLLFFIDRRFVVASQKWHATGLHSIAWVVVGLLAAGSTLDTARFIRSGTYLNGEFRAVSSFLADHTTKADTIAVMPAGIPSYATEAYVLDMFGLTDYHIARQKTYIGLGTNAGHDKTDLNYVFENKPKYILTYAMDALPKTITADEKSDESYKKAEGPLEQLYNDVRFLQYYRQQVLPAQYVERYPEDDHTMLRLFRRIDEEVRNPGQTE